MNDIITLSTNETDKLGNPIKVFYVASHNIPRKLSSFILSHWSTLIDSGHCNPNYVPSFANKKIVYITRDDEVIASLMWTIDNNSAFIDFTVVDDNNKRLGLYGTLHKYFNQVNQKFNIKTIRSQLHADNPEIIDAAKQQGYTVEYYRMVKHVS
jgi:hypothetical protein